MSKSYKREKPSNNYDCIIIGSGISGISLAAILAKEGWKCLILERHYTPGGFTHVFKRRDYEWDVGIHYIGEVHRKQSVLRQMFDYVSDNNLGWEEMDANYDRIYFGKESFDLIAGKENFINKLSEYFPEERANIENYVSIIKAGMNSAKNYFTEKALPPVMSKLMGNSLRKKGLQYSQQTTKSMLDSITDNVKLKGVLTGQYGDYGLTPSQSSFMMHCGVVKHYLNGGAFPIGGSAAIFDTIEPVIEAAGGAVYTNAEVDEIIVENNKATGVKMADGQVLSAPKIISSAGAEITFKQLLKNNKKLTNQHKATNNVSASACHVCLYVGLNADQKTLQLPKTNYWIYPENGYDHDETLNAFWENPEEAPFPVVYISFPSAKDPTWEKRYSGKSTIEIITISKWDWFKNWEKTSWHKRGDDYEQFKENISQRLLEYMYDYVPQTKEYLDVYELSTPLSTKHFVNYQKGEIYGLEHSPKRFNDKSLRAITPLKNFYLTGQDIVTAGIGGAFNAAVITASAMLKKNMMKKILSSNKS